MKRNLEAFLDVALAVAIGVSLAFLIAYSI